MPLHLEHIIPIAAGGKTIEENLWLACPLCNGHKSTKTAGVDPETAQSVTLFNPRRQNWQIHFEWSTDGVKINGLTPVGRATVDTLHPNNKYLIQARRRWVLAGWHPPEE